jgi:hypothetical protein
MKGRKWRSMHARKMFPNLEARNTPEDVPELPWFVTHDEAKDCPPHANSGLAKIDSGRESDWFVARLLEWPTAHYIVRCCTNAEKLAEALKESEIMLRGANKLLTNANTEILDAVIKQAQAALAEWNKSAISNQKSAIP